MAEAFGTLLVRASPDLVKTLDLNGSDLSRAAMAALFEAARVPAEQIQKALGKKTEAYPHEGISLDHGFVSITTFGDEWMKPLKHLVKHGQGLECYGRIEHEYGYLELYSSGGLGKGYFGTINPESDDEDKMQRTSTQWLSRVPPTVREQFAELFAFDHAATAEADAASEEPAEESGDEGGSGEIADTQAINLRMRALHPVLMSDDVNALSEWMGEGFDVNRPVDGDNFLAYYAALHNAITCLKFLADKGTKLDARNSLGETLLVPAVETGALECMQFLLERRVDPNARDQYGRTVLFTLMGSMVCANKGAVFDLLDQYGIDVNYKTDGGMTPLLQAARESSLVVAKRIIDRVTDINFLSPKGRTALDLAESNTDVQNEKVANRARQIVEPLQQKGAKRGSDFAASPKPRG